MSAFTLRLIAVLAMLCDHIGYCWGVEILRIIGRIAFPLFLYLIYNGYRHTSHRGKYALRLSLFALISQIPFSLFCTNGLHYARGNVFMTLLICLLVVWGTDELWNRKMLRLLTPFPALVSFALYYFGYLRSDYGPKGVLMVMVFYLFEGQGVWRKLCMGLGVFASVFYAKLISCGFWCLYTLFGKPYSILPMGDWELLQVFSLLSLPLIFLYNGQKGGVTANARVAKAVQYGFYLFYPLHMLVLWLLRIL